MSMVSRIPLAGKWEAHCYHFGRLIALFVAYIYSGRIRDMEEYPEVDYLVVGHITLDITSTGLTPGGTATYSARVAQALGCRTGILTSAAEDLDLAANLPGISVKNIPAAETTTFENIYKDETRRQKVYSFAEPIRGKDVPATWLRTPIVHLGPVANEVDVELINLFSNSLVGLTPQGWIRTWDAAGNISEGEWPGAEDVLPMAAAVILSRDDVSNASVLEDFRRSSGLLVLTEQAGGCTVYFRGERRHFPAPEVQEVDPTGAGDSFAAAFFIRLHQTRGNPWEAAVFANQIASVSVTEQSLDSKIGAISSIVSTKQFTGTHS